MSEVNKNYLRIIGGRGGIIGCMGGLCGLGWGINMLMIIGVTEIEPKMTYSISHFTEIHVLCGIAIAVSQSEIW